MYIVINQDNSIHTISEKEDDVLVDGQQRFEMEEKPANFFSDSYYWDSQNQQLVKKTQAEIDAIQNEKQGIENRQKKIEAMRSLRAVEELEILDANEDYTQEKAGYQQILNDLIV